MSDTTVERLQHKIKYYTELSNQAGKQGNNLLATKYAAMVSALYEEAVLIELPVTPPEIPAVEDRSDDELAIDLGNVAKALMNAAKDLESIAKKVKGG